MKLDGKVAVVTGAAGGIGSRTAALLAAPGCRVVVADVGEEAGEKVAAGIRADGGLAEYRRVDLRQAESVEALVAWTVERFGRLDILHNNAAATHLYQGDAGVAELDPDHWDQIFEINLRGTMLGCKYAVPQMVAQGSGSIVNMSSTRAGAGALDLPAYAASKAGVESLTRYVATRYGKQGLRCNAVKPGLIVTPQSAALHAEGDGLAGILRHVLLPEPGTPDDVAELVCFLGSEAARYITAQVITVDGGMLAHQPFLADSVAAAAPDRH